MVSGFSSSNEGGWVIIVIITKREVHLKCFGSTGSAFEVLQYIHRCQIGGRLDPPLYTREFGCARLRGATHCILTTAFTSLASSRSHGSYTRLCYI